MSHKPSHVRVVALGDSLTVGFQSYGLLGVEESSAPYTDYLVEQARKEFTADVVSLEVLNKGIVGELTEQMLSRFDSDVIRASPKIVIILGGSNDLGWGLSVEEVFSNLREMYELSLRNGITSIACTVPSILDYDDGIPPRITLNRLIQEYCWKTHVRCADLFTATMERATGRLAARYSSDGLHLNAEGYRRMGLTIYEQALAPILRSMLTHESPR